MWGKEIEGGEGGIARRVEGYGRGGGERDGEGKIYGSFLRNVEI